MRLLFPSVLILAAIGLFVLYTNPTYQGLKATQTKVAAYDDALNTAKQLKQQREVLTSKLNAFSPDDVQKLQRLLPDNVDNIRLIIDINNIAARHGLSLTGLALGDVSDASKARAQGAVGASGDPVGSVGLGFGVVASYNDFLAFLQDLEHSLRMIDVEKLGFKAADSAGAKYNINFTIRTYWLH